MFVRAGILTPTDDCHYNIVIHLFVLHLLDASGRIFGVLNRLDKTYVYTLSRNC